MPPAAPALPTVASTSSRLSAETQMSTSLACFASAIGLGVNWRNLSWVSSMAWIVSENTMHEAVLSQNRSSLRAPTAS